MGMPPAFHKNNVLRPVFQNRTQQLMATVPASYVNEQTGQVYTDPPSTLYIPIMFIFPLLLPDVKIWPEDECQRFSGCLR